MLWGLPLLREMDLKDRGGFLGLRLCAQLENVDLNVASFCRGDLS